MVVSGHAALLVAAIVLGAGAVAVVAAKLLADGILADVESVRNGLTAVGGGEREVRIATTASDELAELADAANAMIAEAARRGGAPATSPTRRGVTSSRPSRTTSARRSRRCGCCAEAVEDDIVDEHTRASYLARMRTHIDALSALIDDLFELSRLEAGDIRWTLERVPLDELVDETVDAMRVQAERKGVAVLASIPDALGPARANPEKLQRVLFNLIQNAIRHTPADGSVVVRAEPVADRIEVEVADTGDGIAPGERERVFTPFYRGGADAARTTGRRRPRPRGLACDRRGARRAASGLPRPRSGRACGSACPQREAAPMRGWPGRPAATVTRSGPALISTDP